MPGMTNNEAIAAKITADERAFSTTGDQGSTTSPALVSHNGRVWMAWTGSDRRINLMSSVDGTTFDQKVVLDERTSAQPALVSHNGRLVLAWTGGGDKVNIATLAF